MLGEYNALAMDDGSFLLVPKTLEPMLSSRHVFLWVNSGGTIVSTSISLDELKAAIEWAEPLMPEPPCVGENIEHLPRRTKANTVEAGDK